MQPERVYVCTVISEQSEKITHFSTSTAPKVDTVIDLVVKGAANKFEVIDVYSQSIGESKYQSVLIIVRPVPLLD